MNLEGIPVSEYPMRRSNGEILRVPQGWLKDDLDYEQIGVNGHANDGIGSDPFEGVDLVLAADASGDNQLSRCLAAEADGYVDRKPLKEALAIDMSVEECRHVRLELRNGLIWSKRHFIFPALYRDAAFFCIDTGDNPVATDGLFEFHGERRVD
jgi:hypothetical protein